MSRFMSRHKNRSRGRSAGRSLTWWNMPRISLLKAIACSLKRSNTASKRGPRVGPGSSHYAEPYDGVYTKLQHWSSIGGPPTSLHSQLQQASRSLIGSSLYW
ncbi:hypothetical protein XENOCAPTIV_029881 [Xenoophorus captivus]|uniref:Uncharacterized protein n=1 Tax=Xenoophorus captivus TaxID=1517983 RepID=A0ABV0SDX0_9TELE